MLLCLKRKVFNKKLAVNIYCEEGTGSANIVLVLSIEEQPQLCLMRIKWPVGCMDGSCAVVKPVHGETAGMS